MIPPKRPKFMSVVSVKQNGSQYGTTGYRVYFKLQGERLEKSFEVFASTAAGARQQAKNSLPSTSKITKVVKISSRNPSHMAKSVVALRRKIRANYTAGMPEDQITAAERKIVRNYPQYFENDYGYIKVKVTGKRRARNVYESPLIPKFNKYLITGTMIHSDGAKSDLSLVVEARNGKEALRLVNKDRGKGVKWTTAKLVKGISNPYASEAQRRKFHAMAERGEISQAVVNEYDKASKGMRLPERANGKGRKELTVPEKHQKRIALQTLKMSEVGARIMGGMTHAEARAFLKKIGHTDEYIRKAENATATEFKQHQKVRLQDLVRKFQGHANGLKHRLLEADTAPKHKYLLGCLALMKVKANGKIVPIEFNGHAYLAADLRNNLHAVGKDAVVDNVKKPNPGMLKELGKLIQIDYITAKSHIENGETVRFWHKLGEVDGEHPTLYIDHDGFPIINGGGYDIWQVGIVN